MLLNKNTEAVTLDMKRYAQLISPRFHVKDIISDKNFDVQDTFTIPARTAMILEVKE